MADATMRTVQFLSRSTTGTQNVTVSGAGTPSAWIAVLQSGTSDSTAGAHVRFCVGIGSYYSSTIRQAVCHMATADNESGSTLNSTSGGDNDAILKVYDPTQDSNSVDYEAYVSSMVTDGIELTWSAVGGGTQVLCTVHFLYGLDWAYEFDGLEDDLTNYYDDMPFSGAPGEPDALIAITARCNEDDTATGDVARLSIGFSINDGSETNANVATWMAYDVKASYSGQVAYYIGTSGILSHTKGKASVPSWERAVKSYDSTGATLEMPLGASAEDRHAFIAMLALKFAAGTQLHLGTQNTPTSTGTWSITSPGFEPLGMFIGLGTSLTYGSIANDPTGNVIGLAGISADEQACNVAWIEHGQTTRVSKTQASDQALDHPSWAVGGGVEAVGGLFRIYPIPGGVHTSFFPFVVELRTQSNRVITSDTEYDAAIAEDSTDPLVPGELTTENLLPVRLYAMGNAWIGEPALKMLPSVVVVNPSNILPGGQG